MAKEILSHSVCGTKKKIERKEEKVRRTEKLGDLY